MPPNPYMKPDMEQSLATLLMSLGGGISAAAGAGRPFYEGFTPAAQAYGGALAQQRQSGIENDRWERQFGMMEAYRKAQTDQVNAQLELKRQEAERDRQLGFALQDMLRVPGMNAPQSQPTMGPPPELLKEGPGKAEYLVSKHGFSPLAANATVGNLFHESRFNPNAVHDNGTGYGLAGWRLDRREGLLNFARAQGREPGDPNVQLDFLAQEMKSGDMGAQRAWSMLQQAKTPQDANTALMHFFRPQGYTPSNPTAGHGYGDRLQYAQALMPGAQPPQGAPAPSAQQPDLDPQTRAAIAAMSTKDPKKALEMYVAARQGLKKEDSWEPLSDANARMYLGSGYDENKAYQRSKVTNKIEVLGERKKLDAFEPVDPAEAQSILGPGYDPNKAYQRNKATGKLEVIGGSLVNIQHQTESAFNKQVAEQDAKRLGAIQENTQSVLDTVAKVRSAADLLAQTYTGVGGDMAQQWYKILGSVGVESAKDKANAAAAAQAIIADITPKMRVPGSGATSDFEMRVFGQAIPSLLNLPGGNEKVAQYWERIAERQMAIQGLAEKHAMESKRLTGTKFAEEVKALGPLFSAQEIKEMQEAAKAKSAPANRPPLGNILGGDQNMTPAPAGAIRPPLESILGR